MQKIKTALFTLLLAKPNWRFPKQGVTSVMGIVLSAERFNTSCLCARSNKIRKKNITKSKLWIGTQKLQEFQN